MVVFDLSTSFPDSDSDSDPDPDRDDDDDDEGDDIHRDVSFLAVAFSVLVESLPRPWQA